MKHLRKGIILTLLIIFSVFITEKPASATVINPNQVYTYAQMEKDIMALAKAYPDLIEYKVIGKSEYGRNIYAISLGRGEPTVFINGAHHAREWLTTTLNMQMIEQYASAYNRGTKISGYDVKSVLNKMTIWFVPMVNPDGVTLQQYGLKAFPSSVHADLIKMNGGSTDFKRWKANAKGVDLNRQYNADWANIKYDPGKPSYKNYKGAAPHSAAEVKAVLNFVAEINPEAAVAYHSSGEVLYWSFHQTGSWYNRDHAYAKKIGQMTGYSLVYPGANPSGGGFTDWFIIQYKRPGFTPEISRAVYETSPPLTEFPRAWNKNQGVGLYVAEVGYQLNLQRVGSVIKKAEQQVNLAVSKSKGLRYFYSGSIKSVNDLKVTTSFSNAYKEASKAIQAADKALASLPKKDQDRLSPTLQQAYTFKNSTAIFIDTMKAGDQLLSSVQSFNRTVNSGVLNDTTVQTYHQFSYQLRKTEGLINKLYDPAVRKLAANKYALPAKILKETVIYEVSRYMLIQEIHALVDANNVEIIESKLAELKRLEKRSIEIKKAGNQKYPGKYPELPGFEQTLQSMKEELLKEVEALKPTEPVEVEQQPTTETNEQDSQPSIVTNEETASSTTVGTNAETSQP